MPKSVSGPASGADRDVAWEELDRRLAEARERDEPALLLHEDAVRTARDLVAATDPAMDLAAARALASFHWARFLILPAGANRADFDESLRYFGIVFPVEPGFLPDQVRDSARATIRRQVKRRRMFGIDEYAGALFEEHQRTGQLPPLLKATWLLRAAVEVTPVGGRH
jgi:hypothetical protein